MDGTLPLCTFSTRTGWSKICNHAFLQSLILQKLKAVPQANPFTGANCSIEEYNGGFQMGLA